jgi:catechol 2,3-dioxygenase-like lactoylglutathione lyase family enzyme
MIEPKGIREMSQVTEIRYVGYGVVDLPAERAFYAEKWGLTQVGEQDGAVYFAAEGHDEKFVLRLRGARENRIDVVALAANARADVNALHDKVVAASCRVISTPGALTTPGGGYGFRFYSPDGMTLEISCDVARGPAREMDRWDSIPKKISHIVFHSPDQHAAAKFFCDVLGFKISDWLGDFMVFLRCNTAHHRIAFLPGPACLNHVAYDMEGVDAMMRGVHNLKIKDVPVGWGPGRHTAGNNTFSYFVTPNNFVAEYTADLEEVDDLAWEPQVFTPAPLVMDQWGIGVGGPQTLPHPSENPGLFENAEG